MKKQFVTYEIALALKELGFNEECLARYEAINSKIILQITHTGSQGDFSWQLASAALWQQAIDFLREKYDIQICEYTDGYKIYSWKNENLICNIQEGKSLFECREKSILKAIEIIKEQNEYTR